MKNFFLFLLASTIFTNVSSIGSQPAREARQSKPAPAENKTAKFPEPKTILQASSDNKQKPQKDTTQQEVDFSKPLSWRPGLLF